MTGSVARCVCYLCSSSSDTRPVMETDITCRAAIHSACSTAFSACSSRVPSGLLMLKANRRLGSPLTSRPTCAFSRLTCLLACWSAPCHQCYPQRLHHVSRAGPPLCELKEALALEPERDMAGEALGLGGW